MSKLAVLIPTRSRPHNIAPILLAWDKTGAWECADLILVIDQDDDQLSAYIEAIGQDDRVQRMFMPTWRPLVDKLNRTARLAANDYPAVAFMGDDHLPRTPGWAELLHHYATTGGPQIVYGRDGIQDIRLPTWWAMSSVTIQRLGGMVPVPDLQHLYCDNAVKAIGQRAGCLTYLDDVLIEHVHPVSRKVEWDAQHIRVNRPEQYDRDRRAFNAWVQSGGLTRNVQALLGVSPPS